MLQNSGMQGVFVGVCLKVNVIKRISLTVLVMLMVLT